MKSIPQLIMISTRVSIAIIVTTALFCCADAGFHPTPVVCSNTSPIDQNTANNLAKNTRVVFQSENYPRDYVIKTDCWMNFSAQNPNHRLRIQFFFFSIDDQSFLSIYDNLASGDQLLANFTGDLQEQINDINLPDVTIGRLGIARASSGNSVSAHFVTNSSVLTGFRGIVQAFDPLDDTDDNAVDLDVDPAPNSGVILNSPLFPNKRPGPAARNWTLTAPTGAHFRVYVTTFGYPYANTAITVQAGDKNVNISARDIIFHDKSWYYFDINKIIITYVGGNILEALMSLQVVAYYPETSTDVCPNNGSITAAVPGTGMTLVNQPYKNNQNCYMHWASSQPNVRIGVIGGKDFLMEYEVDFVTISPTVNLTFYERLTGRRNDFARLFNWSDAYIHLQTDAVTAVHGYSLKIFAVDCSCNDSGIMQLTNDGIVIIRPPGYLDGYLGYCSDLDCLYKVNVPQDGGNSFRIQATMDIDMGSYVGNTIEFYNGIGVNGKPILYLGRYSGEVSQRGVVVMSAGSELTIRLRSFSSIEPERNGVMINLTRIPANFEQSDLNFDGTGPTSYGIIRNGAGSALWTPKNKSNSMSSTGKLYFYPTLISQPDQAFLLQSADQNGQIYDIVNGSVYAGVVEPVVFDVSLGLSVFSSTSSNRYYGGILSNAELTGNFVVLLVSGFSTVHTSAFNKNWNVNFQVTPSQCAYYFSTLLTDQGMILEFHNTDSRTRIRVYSGFIDPTNVFANSSLLADFTATDQSQYTVYATEPMVTILAENVQSGAWVSFGNQSQDGFNNFLLPSTGDGMFLSPQWPVVQSGKSIQGQYQQNSGGKYKITFDQIDVTSSTGLSIYRGQNELLKQFPAGKLSGQVIEVDGPFRVVYNFDGSVPEAGFIAHYTRNNGSQIFASLILISALLGIVLFH